MPTSFLQAFYEDDDNDDDDDDRQKGMKQVIGRLADFSVDSHQLFMCRERDSNACQSAVSA